MYIPPAEQVLLDSQLTAGRLSWGESVQFLTSRKVFGPKTDKCSAGPYIATSSAAPKRTITRQEIRARYRTASCNTPQC
jgi:hypothetical protein